MQVSPSHSTLSSSCIFAGKHGPARESCRASTLGSPLAACQGSPYLIFTQSPWPGPPTHQGSCNPGRTHGSRVSRWSPSQVRSRCCLLREASCVDSLSANPWCQGMFRLGHAPARGSWMCPHWFTKTIFLRSEALTAQLAPKHKHDEMTHRTPVVLTECWCSPSWGTAVQLWSSSKVLKLLRGP